MILAFLLAGPAYDAATRRRVHPAYVWAVLVGLLSIPPVVEQLAATGAWRALASILMH